MTNSHTPRVTSFPRNKAQDVSYNVTLDYRDYALSFYIGQPPELLIFAPGDDREDVTPTWVKAIGKTYLSATAEGIRDAMRWIDSES